MTSLLELLETDKYRTLWDGDGGCPCGELYIQGIGIATKCWRVSGDGNISIRVHCTEDVADFSYLKRLALKVKEQLHEGWPFEDDCWTIYINGEKLDSAA